MPWNLRHWSLNIRLPQKEKRMIQGRNNIRNWAKPKTENSEYSMRAGCTVYIVHSLIRILCSKTFFTRLDLFLLIVHTVVSVKRESMHIAVFEYKYLWTRTETRTAAFWQTWVLPCEWEFWHDTLTRQIFWFAFSQNSVYKKCFDATVMLCYSVYTCLWANWNKEKSVRWIPFVHFQNKK